MANHMTPKDTSSMRVNLPMICGKVGEKLSSIEDSSTKVSGTVGESMKILKKTSDMKAIS